MTSPLGFKTRVRFYELQLIHLFRGNTFLQNQAFVLLKFYSNANVTLQGAKHLQDCSLICFLYLLALLYLIESKFSKVRKIFILFILNGLKFKCASKKLLRSVKCQYRQGIWHYLCEMSLTDCLHSTFILGQLDLLCPVCQEVRATSDKELIYYSHR